MTDKETKPSEMDLPDAPSYLLAARAAVSPTLKTSSDAPVKPAPVTAPPASTARPGFVYMNAGAYPGSFRDVYENPNQVASNNPRLVQVQLGSSLPIEHGPLRHGSVTVEGSMAAFGGSVFNYGDVIENYDQATNRDYTSIAEVHPPQGLITQGTIAVNKPLFKNRLDLGARFDGGMANGDAYGIFAPDSDQGSPYQGNNIAAKKTFNGEVTGAVRIGEAYGPGGHGLVDGTVLAGVAAGNVAQGAGGGFAITAGSKNMHTLPVMTDSVVIGNSNIEHVGAAGDNRHAWDVAVVAKFFAGKQALRTTPAAENPLTSYAGDAKLTTPGFGDQLQYTAYYRTPSGALEPIPQMNIVNTQQAAHYDFPGLVSYASQTGGEMSVRAQVNLTQRLTAYARGSIATIPVETKVNDDFRHQWLGAYQNLEGQVTTLVPFTDTVTGRTAYMPAKQGAFDLLKAQLPVAHNKIDAIDHDFNVNSSFQASPTVDVGLTYSFGKRDKGR